MRLGAFRKISLGLTVFLVVSLVHGESAPSAEMQQCQTQCATAEAQCSTAVRKAKSQCARNAATNGLDPVTLRRDNEALFCDYFQGDRCAYSANRQRCMERSRLRHGLCLDTYTKNPSQRYFECSDSERNALALCREEMADCRVWCER